MSACFIDTILKFNAIALRLRDMGKRLNEATGQVSGSKEVGIGRLV